MVASQNSIQVMRRFSTTRPLQHVRRLHMTEPKANPSQLMRSQSVQSSSQTSMSWTPESSSQPTPIRHFNTSRSLKSIKDSSPIDFAYMPQYTLETPSQPEIFRIPLLPHNFSPLRENVVQAEAVEEVIRPEISTVSANGNYVVSPMSEVTDNHAIEINPYDLTKQVTMAAMRVMDDVKVGMAREESIVREIWSGMLDDFFGSSKLGRA